MDRKFAEQWLNNLKEAWWNKDIEKATSLFTKITFYQETPFMKTYTTFEEIKQEWQHIKNQNIKNIEFKILAIDKNVLIVEWLFEEDMTAYDGIYEIKFNDNLECIYFKSWEMENKMEKHELVDRIGNKTGKILTHIEARDPNNVPDGYYISVVGVVIINDENEILLQKRSRYKRANPSKWGICGGKVDLGETPLDAGIRETFEEIGIRLKKDEFKFLSMDTNEKSHFTVYYVRKNVDVDECQIQQEELEEVRYFKIEELKELDNEGFEWLNDLKKII